MLYGYAGVSYCKFGNFREDFIFAKLRACGVSREKNPREIVKTLCTYLMKVNHIDVANFLRGKYAFNTTRENKILAKKFPNLQYYFGVVLSVDDLCISHRHSIAHHTKPSHRIKISYVYLSLIY